MTADPITAALNSAEEAAREQMRAPISCTQHAACKYAPCACARDAARAAVVAFLRAMPVGLPTAEEPHPMRFVDASTREAWASAVEAGE